MRRITSILATVQVCLLVSPALRGEVIDANAVGFSTRHSVAVAAPRMTVYKALVSDVGSWWNPDHTVSGNAASLYIEPRVHGCFCEVLGTDAGLAHMTVTFINPGVMLRLTGGLGPLGLMGVAGNMTFELEEADGVTQLTLQYAVGGYRPDGLDSIAPAVDGVLSDAIERLKSYVEHGDPQHAGQ